MGCAAEGAEDDEVGRGDGMGGWENGGNQYSMINIQ